MNKRIFSLTLALLLVLSAAVPGGAAVKPEKTKDQILDDFELKSSGKLKYYEQDGHVFISGVLSGKRNSSMKDAHAFLDENEALFKIEDAMKGFKPDEIKKDENGHTFVSFKQKIKGIEVLNSEIIVHYDETGVIVGINGNYKAEKEVEKPGSLNISKKEAIKKAKSLFDYQELGFEPDAEKVILEKDGNLYEAYMVNIYYFGQEVGNYDVYVETSSGEVIEIEDNIRYDGHIVGQGINVSGSIVDLNLYQSGSSYYMRDIVPTDPTEIKTFTLNNKTSLGYLIYTTVNPPYFADEPAGVSAHYGAGAVYDFYNEMFNRNSLDGNGMTIKSFVHYKMNYNNAFWDGYEMVYGDGDGVQFTYFSGDLDVVAHEMTHGVTDYEADLVYKAQSGALNESMSDVFGVLVETYDKAGGDKSKWSFNAEDWVVGDEIYTPNIPGDYLRSLANPSRDHMDEYLYTTQDYGGVHTNCGIPNKAAFLIAQSIGMEKTAKIYYKALTDIMTPETDFAMAYLSLRDAAAALGYGDDVSSAIKYAFEQVGIKESMVQETSIAVSPETLNLIVKQKAQLTAVTVPSNSVVTWKSSNNKVAVVDSSGMVTAKGAGMASITASLPDGKSAVCTVYVTRK